MVRVPNDWYRIGLPARLAGSQPIGCRRTASAQRIPSPSIDQYNNQVTVDLGNDGMAPTVLFGGSGLQDIYEDIYFDQYGQTNVGTNQAATAFVGPSSGGDLWSLDQCFLSTSIGPLDPAQCQVFVGPLPLAQYAVTGSLQGGSSQFGMGGVGCPFGWFVYALWTGGTQGALAYLRLTGTKTVLAN